MTFTIGWWGVPLAVFLIALVIAVLVDGEEMASGEMLSGCLGFSIIAVGTLVAIGITIGHYL